MPALDNLLAQITASRLDDPLAPATVIVPSRLAALQLRRRLATLGDFAGVRFEPMARIAELLAAADLARQDRRPLARPIADYVAAQVALQSRAPLHQVAALQGYAVALRQTFRRLRRAGFTSEADLPAIAAGGQLPEIARLYGLFRERTKAFYDEDDLLDLASQRLRGDTGQVLPELGAVWVLPPVTMSASAAAFLEAVRAVVPAYEQVEIEASTQPDERFVLAPDAASEARAVVRGVIETLQGGAGLDQIAVFYSGDRAYRGLLANAFEAAEVPIAAMPGTPLVELAAGRAVLALARLPLGDYARAELFDFLGLTALRGFVPAGSELVALRAGPWLRLAREAGITHGATRWHENLDLLLAERRESIRPEHEVSDSRRSLYEEDIASIPQLQTFVGSLIGRLRPLDRSQPAHDFVPAFRDLLDAYFAPDAEGLTEIRAEIDQLGTIDAVGGEFNLTSFADALEANLRTASRRDRALGDGILVTSYRAAGGLSFPHVFLCGAYEGAFPAVTESEPLLQDEVWAALRRTHPYAEDLGLRIQRSRAEVSRLMAAAEGGALTWISPLLAAGGTREYYPAPDMTSAAHRHDDSIKAASHLRGARSSQWLHKSSSPLSALLTGPAIDGWERRLRESIYKKQKDIGIGPGHWLEPARKLLRERRSSRFTPYDGNVSLPNLVAEGGSVSPTSLEHYATCGFRYFLGFVLRLRPIDEPEEGDTIGSTERGSLVHAALERFFREQCTGNHPQPGYRWSKADLERLLAIFEEEFESLKQQGRTGLEVYADYDRRLLHADLSTFLEKDSDFRAETGAIPADFERRVGPVKIGDVTVSGFVDRIDRTPDGAKAWVLDYKTGSSTSFEKLTEEDPFLGGSKLQLPIYVLAAGDIAEVHAAYWFISRRGGFERKSYKNTPENKERFKETIGAIMDGVRSGSFPAVPGEDDDFHNSWDNCRFCDFTRICSRRRVYEHQDKQDDPGLLPWSRVTAVARGEVPPSP